MYCWVLIFALSPFYILIYMFLEIMHWKARGLSYKPNIFVSWSTSELRVSLTLWNWFKPSSKILILTVPRRCFLCRSFVCCFFCVLFFSCFCVCSLLPYGHLLGKGWPLGSCWWCLLYLCYFPCGILCQVWYLIVSFPDLCLLSYLHWSISHDNVSVKKMINVTILILKLSIFHF